MPRPKAANKRGGKSQRLESAHRLLEQAWDVLDPADISADRWQELRNLIVAVIAAGQRVKK